MRHLRPIAFAPFLVCVVLLASPRSGWAFDLLETDDLTVGANAYVSGVIGAEIPSSGDADYGAFLRLARLKMDADYTDKASVKVQFGGSEGVVELVDAEAAVRPWEPLEIRVGRYKTSVSPEFLRSAIGLPFIGRALLNEFVPRRRTGVEAVGRFAVGDIEIQPQVGLFQPARTTFTNPQGELLTGRLLVGTAANLDFHVGYAQHVFEENDLPGTTGTTPAQDRVVVYNSPLDVAVTYRNGGLDLHAEGVWVADPPRDDTVLAGYLHATYLTGPEDGIQLEPTVAYDIVHVDDFLHRASGGLNVHWWNTGFASLLDYRLRVGGGRELHTILLALRGQI